MLLHVQLLYLCWISNTAGSIQLKKNEPHHLFRRCSNCKHNLLHFWGLTPIVHRFCRASRCTDAEHLHPACAFSTANNVWNAASHLPRERAWCKVTLCWIVFPSFFVIFVFAWTVLWSNSSFLLSYMAKSNCGEKDNRIKWINGCLA